jgi:hypothetical protein
MLGVDLDCEVHHKQDFICEMFHRFVKKYFYILVWLIVEGIYWLLGGVPDHLSYF